MAATSNPLALAPCPTHLWQSFHQVWKRFQLSCAGINPTAQIFVSSPNPGEQAWFISAKHLQENPLVLSLGLAENLSFDLGMIQNYAAVVHGFDPTLASRQWVGKNALPKDFHYHALAVAGLDGWVDLIERRGKGGKRRGPTFQRAPCRRLSSLLEELSIGRVDVLKMDIEGCEYDVIDDIVSAGIFPSQIAVEFHHRFEEIGLQKTRGAHQTLRRHGYDLAHISPWAEEFLYIRRRPA